MLLTPHPEVWLIFGCPRPDSQTLFKPMQGCLVHHRHREEPSRNPALSNLSSFRPRERCCSTSLFSRKRENNMPESFHGSWWWNHQLSFSAKGNSNDSHWRHNGTNQDVGVPASPTQNRDIFSGWSENGGYLKKTSSIRKASPNPGNFTTSHLKNPSTDPVFE